jgi:hypothetical protein
MSKMPNTYVPLPDVRLVFQQLVEDLNIEMVDVELHDKKYAQKSAFTTGKTTLGGISYALRMGGRPINDKKLVSIIQGQSQRQGTAFSASQARSEIDVWLWSESQRLFLLKYDPDNSDNHFNIDNYIVVEEES